MIGVIYSVFPASGIGTMCFVQHTNGSTNKANWCSFVYANMVHSCSLINRSYTNHRIKFKAFSTCNGLRKLKHRVVFLFSLINF